MKNVLWIDCCIRGEASRTLRLSRAFLDALPEDCQVTHLDLMQLQPRYFSGAYFDERQRLLEQGALGARMTGSGSAVFGLFSDRETAEQAAQALRPLCRETFFARALRAGETK